MKRILVANAGLLLLTALLGFWMQSLGVGADGLQERMARYGDLWPLFFPAFGLFFAALVFGVTYKSTQQVMQDEYVPKSMMRPALAISFGPVLAFLLQAYVGLRAVDGVSEQGMMLGVAVLQILFFLAMGNYTPSLKAGGALGLRTPWTLRDDLVWNRTHRVLGRGLVIVSLAVMPLLVFLEPFTVIKVHFGAIIAVKLSSIAYSWMTWRAISNQHA